MLADPCVMDETVAAWVAKSTADQGKPEQVEDPETIMKLAVLMRVLRRKNPPRDEGEGQATPTK